MPYNLFFYSTLLHDFDPISACIVIKYLCTNSIKVEDIDCCIAILTVVPPNGIVLTNDEEHFYLSGTVNKQCFRHWIAENP